MTLTDFQLLQSPDAQRLVEDYLTTDPVAVALRTSKAEIAEQVKYLQRARVKLPSWYSARCLIDGQLFEQSSSEVTARAKFERFSGERAVDLTCGLGVDSAALSANFKQVTAIEIDPIKAEIARYNFSRLGIDNIEVICSSAEEFCAQAVANGERADLIFVDPSRIDLNGRKVYSLEQSSPNVLKLIDLMRQISSIVIIKLSPLFDVDECFRLFQDVECVDVVSVSGECKEVNVVINTLSNPTQRLINHTIIFGEQVQRYPIFRPDPVSVLPTQTTTTPSNQIERRYLYVADVAFYKSRCVELYAAQIVDKNQFAYFNYIFTSAPIADFAGAGYQIIEELLYNPRKIKQLLKDRAINCATIHIRNFNLSQSQLFTTLKIKEGSACHLFFTTVDGVATCFYVNSLNNK